MIVIPKHAIKQMKKRGISDIDVIEAIERGDIVIEEANGRFGTKKYSKMKCLLDDMIVIWFFNKKGDKVVVTAYWRGRRLK
ncbi:MAG TPA: DUF4258 domain-containing protein [archaeon]|nr:DUF4258 domain-containing protein [archaeon]